MDRLRRRDRAPWLGHRSSRQQHREPRVGAAAQGDVSRKRFVVRGLVQGVNFRYATMQQARLLRLSGTVWNRDDGAVEAIAEGDAGALARLEEWLRHGPPHARVEALEAEDLPGEPQHRGFAIG
jgi:acylphosphatase